MIGSRVLETPLGPVRLRWTERGISELSFLDGAEAEAAGEQPDGPGQADPHGAVDALVRWFAGEDPALAAIPVDPEGTEFQREVWAALRRIPGGETRTYAELAAQLGRPRAVRAVGAANGRNPVAILIPCHRVVGADGSLVGYAGGLARKRALLAREGVTVAAERQGGLFGALDP